MYTIIIKGVRDPQKREIMLSLSLLSPLFQPTHPTPSHHPHFTYAGWEACNTEGKGYHNASGYPIVRSDLFPDFKGMTDYAHSLNLTAGVREKEREILQEILCDCLLAFVPFPTFLSFWSDNN